jgi:hypothetical protein
MAKHYRKMLVHGDHLEAPESGPPWTVLWDTAPRQNGEWSTVRAHTEASALERAAHFVKLGFVVHAIKDPSGAVVMNAGEIAARFGTSDGPARRPAPDGAVPSPEKSAHDILRGFVQDFHATPGRMLATSALRALLAPHGVGPSEFSAAVSYAEQRGWLREADGTLILTQAGYAVATH